MNQLPREKMSKSRNNVVTPDEVIYGVYELSRGFGPGSSSAPSTA